MACVRPRCRRKTGTIWAVGSCVAVGQEGMVVQQLTVLSGDLGTCCWDWQAGSLPPADLQQHVWAAIVGAAAAWTGNMCVACWVVVPALPRLLVVWLCQPGHLLAHGSVLACMSLLEYACTPWAAPRSLYALCMHTFANVLVWCRSTALRRTGGAYVTVGGCGLDPHATMVVAVRLNCQASL
jgi:hypothetical protein